jgi:ATP-dependent RNA helicase DDX21
LTASKKRDSKDARDTQPSESGNPGDFSNFPNIDPKTVIALKSRGIVNLFPIQQECFAPIFGRQDVIGRDLTGSGKTFAFALPIVEYLRANNLFGSGKTQAIFMAPTRELAIQITEECNKLKHDPAEFSVVTVYGGVSVQN